MGKCYCDYCDVFLTNDSVAVRKQHNDGNRHKHNVCEYYRSYMATELQEQIDEIVAIFEQKVAAGLIRPTYAPPPPPVQPAAKPARSEESKKGEDDQQNTDPTEAVGDADSAPTEGADEKANDNGPIESNANSLQEKEPSDSLAEQPVKEHVKVGVEAL